MPGGRLPHRATAAAPSRSEANRARKASHSAAVTVGPGSLSWVVSPSAASTTATVRRVDPAVSTSSSRTGVAASPSRRTAPVAPPAKPVATVSYPRAARTRATLSPLPPGRSITWVTRWEARGVRAGTR